MTRERLGTWALWALLLTQLFGMLAAGILTWHHEIALFGGVAEAGELIGCSATDKVNCDLVNTSEWSELLGVPIATWGFATYAVLAGLTLGALTGRRESLPVVFVAGLGATAYSALLYWVSVTEIGYVCAWCMRLYVVNGLTPVLAALAGALREPRPATHVWWVAGAAFLTTSLLSVGGQRLYRASLLGDAATIDLAAVPMDEVRDPHGLDPEGPAPALRFEVKTEDGNDAVLELLPDDAWKGNPEATVTLVEFMDFQCGHCKRAAGELKRLLDVYGDRVLFVAKHFPMDPACNEGVRNLRHRNACQAARAAVCAGEQDRFWAFHDLAFKNQHQLGLEDLLLYARTAGVDLDRFQSCLQDERSLDRVKKDAQHGAALDIHGTPRIFINGELYRGGRSAQQFAAQIERHLGSDPATVRASMARMQAERSPIAPIPPDVPSMREVNVEELRFRIDTFEAALQDGAAVSGKREIPATGMSWFAARDACEAAGKRLCTEQEWLTACQGALAQDDDGDGAFADDLIEGSSYPYGEHHEPGRCWDGKPREGFRPVYTGELPGCVSAYGVYDMTGNVEEWVGDSPETAVLLGGAWDTSKDFARCFRRNATFGPGYANARTGFRCCANP